MPDLALRIAKVVEDPETDNTDITRVIQTDPTLTTRIMGIANSVAMKRETAISDLPNAVGRLGRDSVRDLVFSFVLGGLFRTDSPLLKSRMKDLWAHSRRVAALSFVLAQTVPGMDPNRAMLAGLIHDIGTVPVLCNARNYPVLTANEGPLDTIIDRLRGDMGLLILRQWGFPAEFMDVVLESESWMREEDTKPDGTPRMKDLPQIDKVPAFRKSAFGELTPDRSIALLDRAELDVREVDRLLASR
jgi:HD-like signal output (HDOD) protein